MFKNFRVLNMVKSLSVCCLPLQHDVVIEIPGCISHGARKSGRVCVRQAQLPAIIHFDGVVNVEAVSIGIICGGWCDAVSLQGVKTGRDQFGNFVDLSSATEAKIIPSSVSYEDSVYIDGRRLEVSAAAA